MRAARYASLRPVVTALRRRYGKPAPKVSRNPFHLVLWEQVGYLVPDTQRRRAYTALRKEVGLGPAAILGASAKRLEQITRLGLTTEAKDYRSSYRRAPGCDRCPLQLRCPAAELFSHPGSRW
ncbi:MAG: hypothetical protein DMD66_07720 [Gemmatimonadetes bacterium]|nr:MAG: hypothetical protein DMD66_07720 [Gemmatimonadota bacterium]